MTSLTDLRPMPPYGDLPVPDGVDTVAVDLPVGRLSAYRVVPQGTPKGHILFVPGYTGSKEDFRSFLPLIRDLGYAALAISRRGQADSARPLEEQGAKDPAGYRLEDESGDVVLASALVADGAPVHLVGHSLGGVIARAAAIAAPTAFHSVTLLCSGPHGWPNRKYLERHLTAEAGTAALWDAMNPATHDLPDTAIDPELAFLRQRMRQTAAGSIVGGGLLLERPDDTSRELAATGLPLLVAHGDQDDAWPIPWQRDMAERLGARYEVIADAFHSPQIEHSAATAAVLGSFFS